MKIKINKKKVIILQRFAEYTKYSQVIQLVTLFPYQNIMGKGVVFHAILNFSFKEIQFNKKRVLPFFLALELLTNQKCVATISTKDIFV
jgi:ribosomal protein L5